MAETTIYTDPLGNKLILEEGVYLVEYPADESGEIRQEELPFQQGDVDDGVNGVTNELLLEAVIHRLQRLEAKKPSVFNKLTLQLLKTTRNLLAEKTEEIIFRQRLLDDKLSDGDENALEVMRWNTVVKAVEALNSGLETIISQTYRNGTKMRAVDIRRLKHPAIIAAFQNENR